MKIKRMSFQKHHPRSFRLLTMVLVAVVLIAVGTSCSSTSALADGEQLFTGLKKIEYTDYEPGGSNPSTPTKGCFPVVPFLGCRDFFCLYISFSSLGYLKPYK